MGSKQKNIGLPIADTANIVRHVPNPSIIVWLALLLTFNYLINKNLTIRKPIGYPHQKRKKPLYRHSCQPCRVSDAREQESAVSLNVNLFFECTGFYVSRFRRFSRSDPNGACHAYPNAQAARNDKGRKLRNYVPGLWVLDGFGAGCWSPILCS